MGLRQGSHVSHHEPCNRGFDGILIQIPNVPHDDLLGQKRTTSYIFHHPWPLKHDAYSIYIVFSIFIKLIMPSRRDKCLDHLNTMSDE